MLENQKIFPFRGPNTLQTARVGNGSVLRSVNAADATQPPDGEGTGAAVVSAVGSGHPTLRAGAVWGGKDSVIMPAQRPCRVTEPRTRVAYVGAALV